MFRVKCPMCGGVLNVDERTRKVVGHMTAEEAARTPDEQFESIVDGIQKAKSEQEAKLEAARRREAQRKQHVDELFKKAQEKAKESPDEQPRGKVWD